ncbi:hypothetical protein JCM8208_002344 [Rhodotorula glutinis]
MPPKPRKARTNIAVEVPPPSTGVPSTSAPPPPGPSTRRANVPRQPSTAHPASPRTRHRPATAATTPVDEPGDADTDSSSDAHIHDRLVVAASPTSRRKQRAETELVPETDHEGVAPALGAAMGDFGSPRSKRAGKGYASKGRGARRKGAAEMRDELEVAAREEEADEVAGAEEQGEADKQGSDGESPPLATRLPAAAKRAAGGRPAREVRSAAVDFEEKAERQSEEGEGEGEQDGADDDELDQLADSDDTDTDSSPRPTTKGKGKGKGKAAAQAPASSFSKKRKAASQRSTRASPAKKKKHVAVPERDSGSEEELPNGDEGEGDGEVSLGESSDEDDERPPECVFSHRGGDGSWVPDRIWLHREWAKEGKRDKVARWIKEHGGKVMKRIEDAHYAILPEWTSPSYASLYAQAFHCDAHPTLYAWLLAARDDTATNGVPCRPNPLDFASPRPLGTTRRDDDRRSGRYLRLSDAELDEFARLWNLCCEGEMGRGEMFSRMQREFYSELDSRRTTTSAYRDKFDLHKRTIKQRARRLRDDAKRAHAHVHAAAPDPHAPSPSAFRSPSPPRSPDPPRNDKRRRRRPTPSPPVTAPDPLAALAQRYGRSPAFVDALLRACTLDIVATERALRRLEAWERALDLDGDGDGDEAQRAWEEVLSGVWREEDDEALRDEEGVSDGELARRSGGRWSAREVGERRELLQVRGDERWGWEVTGEELRRAREGEAARSRREEKGVEE